MTTAIGTTVEEYSTTPRPHSTAFSQSRIFQKIMSSQGREPDILPSITETTTPPQSDQSDERAPSPNSGQSDDQDEAVSTSSTLHADSAGNKAEDGDGDANVAAYPNVESITTETIDRNMYTAGCPPLDIFVRTSGVERLSDFMLWQCHQDTQIFFLKCLWPDFDLWHFLPVLVEWQRRQKKKELGDGPRRRAKQE